MRRSVENAEHVGLYRRDSRRFQACQPARQTYHGPIAPTEHACYCPTIHSRNIDSPYCLMCSGRRNIYRANCPRSLRRHARRGQAAHVGFDAYGDLAGLFAPRHGQQYRDDQRRRRSQYDRGTTAAENEARHEGLFDPARVTHPGLDPRTFGAPRFGPGQYLAYY